MSYITMVGHSMQATTHACAEGQRGASGCSVMRALFAAWTLTWGTSNLRRCTCWSLHAVMAVRLGNLRVLEPPRCWVLKLPMEVWLMHGALQWVGWLRLAAAPWRQVETRGTGTQGALVLYHLGFHLRGAGSV